MVEIVAFMQRSRISLDFAAQLARKGGSAPEITSGYKVDNERLVTHNDTMLAVCYANQSGVFTRSVIMV